MLRVGIQNGKSEDGGSPDTILSTSPGMRFQQPQRPLPRPRRFHFARQEVLADHLTLPQEQGETLQHRYVRVKCCCRVWRGGRG